jgi:hypothetical protein
LLAWRVATADLESFWTSGLNLFLAPACVLAVMAAPFTRARPSDGADDALWHFNRLAWFGCAFGLLVGVVLGAGVSGAFAALDALFGLVASPRRRRAQMYPWCRAPSPSSPATS